MAIHHMLNFEGERSRLITHSIDQNKYNLVFKAFGKYSAFFFALEYGIFFSSNVAIDEGRGLHSSSSS